VINKILNVFLPGIFIIAMSILIFKMFTTENEYKVRGELYQCFAEGERIYASNDRPRHLGSNWYIVDKAKFKADECFCMGCIGF